MARKFNTQLQIAKGVQPDHAVTLEQVQEIVEGKVKSPVRVVSNSNLVGSYLGGVFTSTANILLVVDGVTLAVANRVLVAGQTDKTQNGIYVVTNSGNASNSFVLTRADDFNSSDKIFAGVRISVTEGISNGETVWYLATDDPIILDSTSLNFAKDTGQTVYVKQQTFTIMGDASSTQFPFSHGWGTKNLTYEIYNNTSGETEEFDFKRVNDNDVAVACAVPLGVGNNYTLILQAEV